MNIVITGVSKGIGAAVLDKFVQGGHRVLAFSSSKSIINNYKNAVIKPLDFYDFEEDAIAQVIAGEFKQVDILVNNAGVLLNASFEDTTAGDWEKTFTVNLFGTVKIIKSALPQLKASPDAHIVNIGSMGGFQGSSKFPGLAAYSASKAAVANLTECLAEEFKNDNIHVNCLALGAVNTEMLNAAFPGYKAPVESNEIAEFISDFCINKRKFFNGKIIPVAVSTP
ncbi:MAG TPA: SDR family oxidoreductase [Bacteroidia bacterium]|nr:SDR family oxidoreductase [Bacteroidia bacterium]